MLKIRLHRTGKSKRPVFRIVVAEHQKAAQGPYIKSLGFWDPLKSDFKINESELKMWMDRGAKPTDRISRLLTKKGMKHKHIVVHERPVRGPRKLEKEAAPDVVTEEKKEATSDVAQSEKEEQPSESAEVSKTPEEQPVEALKAEEAESDSVASAESKEEKEV